MENKNTARVELDEHNLEKIVGGNFNWYKERGTYLRMCRVTGIGDFYVKDSAKSRYNDLMLEHKNDNWSEQDYVNTLLAEGEFSTNPI